MTKTLNRSIVGSRQVEENIHVPFHILGTPEWINESISSTAISKSNVTLVHSVSDLGQSKKWLSSQLKLGLDSETGGENKRDGLDPLSETSRMLIFQLGTPEMVYLIEPALVPEFKSILESQDRLIIAQNGIYDFKFILQKYGIHFINYYYDKSNQTCKPCFYDTMLAEQLISAGLFGVSVGLEELVEKYPPHRLISKAVRKEFIDLRGLLEYKHLYYAARDVYVLFTVYAAQLALCKKHPGMWERMQIEYCAVPSTADAELTGFVLDEVRINSTLDYWRAKAKRIRDQVIKIYNDSITEKGLKRNFVLPDDLSEFDFEEIDMNSNASKMQALTKLGFKLENVKRETLMSFGDEITNLLGEYSECTKIISTYGEGLLRKRSATTGRFHPEFNQLGSGDLEGRKAGKATIIATGRWSSDAQQFPRPDHILDPTDPAMSATIKSLFPSKYEEAMKQIKGE